jgi:hypothetical protein
MASAQSPEAWVWPKYKTTQPEQKKLTVVSHYTYREQEYDPAIPIRQAVPKAERRQGSPEEAMISRVSAMMAGDYEWWLETWDEASRLLTEEGNEQAGRTPEYFTRWWADTLRLAHIELVRRIETGPYVVVTYRLVTPSGEAAGNGIEFPTVFHRVGDRWLATLDLRRDPLVPASPWISGQRRMEQTVR